MRLLLEEEERKKLSTNWLWRFYVRQLKALLLCEWGTSMGPRTVEYGANWAWSGTK